MRSIKASFLEVREKYPNYSDFVCLSTAVEGRDFNKETISKAFNRLVPKNDYFDSKIRLLNHLVNISKKSLRTRIYKTNLNSKALKT